MPGKYAMMTAYDTINVYFLCVELPNSTDKILPEFVQIVLVGLGYDKKWLGKTMWSRWKIS